MRPNELMMGDWLDLSDVPNEIIPCRVVELRSDELLEIQPDDTACDIVDYYMVVPIAITPEILEKNGFIKVNTQRYDWGNPNGWYVSINPKKKIIHINGANGSNCNMYYVLVGFYVHNLQHALRLCGLNELADNFTV